MNRLWAISDKKAQHRLRCLLKGLLPDHNTISNFRKNNPEAIRKVFRATVELGKRFDLVGGRLIAGDSTKMRAQNSKKNNFNAKKLQEKLDYIDQKLDAYNKELAREDGDKPESEKAAATKKAMATQQARRKQYAQMQQQLEQSDEVQISTSDPDSRQLITCNHITEVGYNPSASLRPGIQTTVDAKPCLLAKPIQLQRTRRLLPLTASRFLRNCFRFLLISNAFHFHALYW